MTEHDGMTTSQLRADSALPPAGQFPGRRILVVDDSRMNRMFLCAMLRALGCRADEATDGAAALDAVFRETYDLVLMDVHMPVLDGLAATRAIRAGGRTDLPILALTGDRTCEGLERRTNAGMNGQLVKPFSATQLVTILSAVFASDEG